MSEPRRRSKSRELIASALEDVAAELDEQRSALAELRNATVRIEHALEQIVSILVEVRGEIRQHREGTSEAIDAIGVRLHRLERPEERLRNGG